VFNNRKYRSVNWIVIELLIDFLPQHFFNVILGGVIELRLKRTSFHLFLLLSLPLLLNFVLLLLQLLQTLLVQLVIDAILRCDAAHQHLL
jgi:hypothetical protein